MSNLGWKCPGCSACWAPQVKGCELCDPRQKADKPSFAEQAAEDIRRDLSRARAGAVGGAALTAAGVSNMPCTCTQVPLPESGYCKFHQIGWGIARGQS